MTWVQYIGYIVDEHGVHANPAKVQSIRDCPTLTTLVDLRSFLGLANFYRKFVLGFSHIDWAVSQVTKGGGKSKFVWSESQHKSFMELKHRLCSSLVLSLLDLQHSFKILTQMVIPWHIIVRCSQMQSKNIPPMIRRCIPLYKPADNGSITFSIRRFIHIDHKPL